MAIRCPCCDAILPSAEEIYAARREDGTYDPEKLARWRVKDPGDPFWRLKKFQARIIAEDYCEREGIELSSIECDP